VEKQWLNGLMVQLLCKLTIKHPDSYRDNNQTMNKKYDKELF